MRRRHDPCDRGLPGREVLDQLDRITDEPADRFHGTFGRETVERYVEETFGLLDRSATVKVYLSKVDGLTMVTAPQVLFVCVHNAGRSQMAAALLQHYSLGRIAVRSAGSEPAEKVNPAASAALAEWGLDITAEVPSKLSTEDVEASDVVITMGCGDTCPVFPGKRYLDWPLEDPAGQGVDAVRPIRNEIDRRVRGLVAEILDA